MKDISFYINEAKEAKSMSDEQKIDKLFNIIENDIDIKNLWAHDGNLMIDEENFKSLETLFGEKFKNIKSNTKKNIKNNPVILVCNHYPNKNKNVYFVWKDGNDIKYVKYFRAILKDTPNKFEIITSDNLSKWIEKEIGDSKMYSYKEAVGFNLPKDAFLNKIEDWVKEWNKIIDKDLNKYKPTKDELEKERSQHRVMKNAADTINAANMRDHYY